MVTHVCRKHLVLRQHAVNGPAETGSLGFLSSFTEDVVNGEVGGDSFADAPAFDFGASGHYLARHIRTRNDIDHLLPERVLSCCNEKLTVLCEGQQNKL